MKKIVIMGLISILAGLFGCSGSNEKGAVLSGDNAMNQPPSSDKTESASEVRAASAVEYHLGEETEFHYLLMRDENKGEYQRAAKVVEKELGVTGKLVEVSRRFGGWFLLEYEGAKQDPDVIELDAAPARRPAYLVDLPGEKVVAKGEFKAADALFRRLFEVIASGDEDENESLTDNAACIVSTIAFGVAECVGHSESDQTAPPRVTKDGDMIRIEYSMDVGGGESVAYKHCVLTINGEEYSFTSDL